MMHSVYKCTVTYLLLMNWLNVSLSVMTLTLVMFWTLLCHWWCDPRCSFEHRFVCDDVIVGHLCWLWTWLDITLSVMPWDDRHYIVFVAVSWLLISLSISTGFWLSLMPDAVSWSTLHCLWCRELTSYLIVYIDGILIVFVFEALRWSPISLSVSTGYWLSMMP